MSIRGEEIAEHKGAAQVPSYRWSGLRRSRKFLTWYTWVLIAIFSGGLGITRECFGAPNPGDRKAALKAAEERARDALRVAEEIQVKYPQNPPNFKGQENPAKAVANVVSDSGEETKNFLRCMDLKTIPGCLCLRFGREPRPAYEYRWPMTRYEVTRQPFQSDYWPRVPTVEFLQKITTAPNIAALVNLDFLTVFSALRRQSFKFREPEILLSSIKSLVNTAFTEIPDKSNNKARGGGLQGDGTTQTSVHAIPSPLRYPPLSKAFEVRMGFEPVNSHILDGFGRSPLPGFTESPELAPYARSPGRSAMIQNEALRNMWKRSLQDPKACLRFSMNEWKKYFNDKGKALTDLMVPGAIDAGSGDVKPKEYPCLRFGNIKWFPFDFHLNVSSEPKAAWNSMVKMAKMMSVTRGVSGGVRNWPDMYDLEDDRAEYLRGQGLSNLQCTQIEMADKEFGDANKLEQPAEPIIITHWKRYSGCPRGWHMVGSCPRAKITRQSAFNPEVKNSTRTP